LSIYVIVLIASIEPDYIARRGRNDYTVYEYATFKEQISSVTFALPRDFNKPWPYKRKNLIIDLPPLKDKIKPGVAVLAPIGRDKYVRDRYTPAKIVKELNNGEYIIQPGNYSKWTFVFFYENYACSQS
jgi:hypothetical protein